METFDLSVMMKKNILFFVFMLLLPGICNAQNAKPTVTNLRCRSMANPIGVVSPDFSWQLSDPAVGAGQQSYQIQVASSEEALRNGRADVWDSGIIISEDQLHIVPPVSFEENTRYYWRVRVTEKNGTQTSWSVPASFSMGLYDTSWKGSWVTADWDKCKSLPYLRKEFTLKEKPVRATAYLCTLGCGDLYVNGAVNEESRILDPAQTNYERYALYTAFEIADKLSAGNNCIGVMLGDGWYHQDKVWGPSFSYGRPKLRFQLMLQYADGSRESVCSDDTWQWAEGPVVYSNIYGGETYDANREVLDWCCAGSKSDAWQPALRTDEALPPSLQPQMMEPIRLLESIPLKKVWKDKKGNWILDFGVNIAAVPRLHVSLPKGTTLKLRMGETLSADSTIDFSTTGDAATGVIQTDIYTCKGSGNETWTPRFTYHGFRYAELSGMEEKPLPSMIEAVIVRTGVSQTGTFHCDNDILNRLHELALRTFLSNIHGIPTDCPHRERCGWLGDAHTVAPFESENCDMENFFMKYMDDVNSGAAGFEKNTLFHKLDNKVFYNDDKSIGLAYMIAPGRRLCGVASPDWGTAQVQIPWDIYWYYGNTETLRKSYEYMEIWTAHVSKLSEDFIVPYGLGDWCPPGGNSKIDCPVPLSSTAFHYRDVSLMEKMAALLSKSADVEYYGNLKRKIAEAFVKKFYDRDKKTFGSQTADAMALDFGLVPEGEEKMVAQSIVKNADEKNNGFIQAGIFGIARIAQVLSRNGCAKEAVRLFTKRGENSFEWMWKEAHATTLWEVLPTSKASEAEGLKSSLNHPMQGGYDTWFYENVAGIRAVAPAYKRIRFERLEGSSVRQASAQRETPYGKAESSWTAEKRKTVWNILIPPGSTGEVVLPSNGKITVNGSKLSQCGFIRSLQSDADNVTFSFPSGTFSIVIK